MARIWTTNEFIVHLKASISSMFYARFFVLIFCQRQNVTRKSCQKRLSYEKSAQKTLMKLTPCDTNCTDCFCSAKKLARMQNLFELNFKQNYTWDRKNSISHCVRKCLFHEDYVRMCFEEKRLFHLMEDLHSLKTIHLLSI